MNFLDKAKSYGSKLLKILFWPFTVIIEIFHFIVDFFNTCGGSLIVLKDKLISLIQNTFKDIEDTILKRKKWKKLLVLLGKITTTNTDLMHGYVLGGITGFLVIILQGISFFTTYGGTSYYFSDIGRWVPFAFAFVVQCTIVTFSLRSSDKTRHKIPQKTVLSIAVVISILFSYIGTINSAIEPYDEFSQDYRNFSESFDVLKESALADKTIALSDDDATQLISNQINNSEIVLLYAHAIANADIADFEINIQPIIQNKTENSTDDFDVDIKMDDNTLSLIENALAQENVASKLRIYINELEEVLYTKNELKPEFLEKNISKYISDDEISDFFIKYNNLYSKTVSLHQFMKEKFSEAYIASKEIAKIERFDLSKKMKNYDTILAIELEDFESFLNDKSKFSTSENVESFRDKALNFIKNTFSLKTSAMETYRTIVDKAQDEAYITYKSISVFTANNPELTNEFETFNEQYETLNNAKDATVVAFKRLFDKKTFNRAIVPAILAILVDGGTILIAWAGQRRKYSYLYANTNRDYFEEEIDLFEQVFIAANDGSGFQDIVNQNISQSDEEFIKSCYDAINNTINFSNEYLNLFAPSPWTVNLGCGIYASEKDLQKDAKYNALTSLLLSFGYLVELNGEDFKRLQQHYYDSTNVAINITDTNYYFLRFRVESYLRQNMSSTSIYARYFLGK